MIWRNPVRLRMEITTIFSKQLFFQSYTLALVSPMSDRPTITRLATSRVAVSTFQSESCTAFTRA